MTLEGEPPEFDVEVNPLSEYLDGMTARQEINGEGVPTATYYLHGDLIGSVNALTDIDGDPINVADGGVSGTDPSPVVCYTAFGERVVYANSTVAIGGDLPTEFARTGYSGQTGYESGFLKLQGANPDLSPITLQHLGHRWYQPGVGRFVQRDPIGIAAGLNLYLYSLANPVSQLDPSGLCMFGSNWDDPISDTLANGWRGALHGIGRMWGVRDPEKAIANLSDGDVVGMSVTGGVVIGITITLSVMGVTAAGTAELGYGAGSYWVREGGKMWVMRIGNEVLPRMTSKVHCIISLPAKNPSVAHHN